MAPSSSSIQDQLLAQLDLADERLERFQTRLTRASERTQERFESRVERITKRAKGLSEQIRGSSIVADRTESAVEDLGAAVDTLEADLEAVDEDETAAYRSAVDRQLRTWRARTDRLRLQTSLGTMDIRDDLEDLGHRLATARAGALLELRRAAADTKGVVIDVRNDLEEVLSDVRRGVERVADSLTHDSDG